MKYLFTYKNGKKALGLSTINRGLAIKAGDTTVYPLLVSPNAVNASCVRFKINNEIKSIAYVPSLIIPGVLCGKSGSSYTDPLGIDFTGKFYKECYYDTYRGQYIAHSHYRTNGGTIYDTLAISIDGKNWIERSITSLTPIQIPALCNTKAGILVCMPMGDRVTQYTDNYTIDISNYYISGSSTQKQTKYTLSLYEGADIDGTFKVDKLQACTNGAGNVVILCNATYQIYSQTYYIEKVWNINTDTNTVTLLSSQKKQTMDEFWKSINYNNILKVFWYKLSGFDYISTDGIHFNRDLDADLPVSYGNLNGMEVLENGLSADGIHITKSYNNRPNAYDPVEAKYIRVQTGQTSAGSSLWNYYFDIYESTDLNSWTFVLRKYHPTQIYSQTLTTVNTDGFACVKGF